MACRRDPRERRGVGVVAAGSGAALARQGERPSVPPGPSAPLLLPREARSSSVRVRLRQASQEQRNWFVLANLQVDSATESPVVLLARLTKH